MLSSAEYQEWHNSQKPKNVGINVGRSNSIALMSMVETKEPAKHKLFHTKLSLVIDYDRVMAWINR